eukprot:3525549-Pleurochrysis_carterae.AAC.1
MPEAQPVGILVGMHQHNLGGLKLHYAHYMDTEAFDAKDCAKAAAQQRLRRSAAHVSIAKTDRKGYRTFRCGDVVQ